MPFWSTMVIALAGGGGDRNYKAQCNQSENCNLYFSGQILGMATARDAICGGVPCSYGQGFQAGSTPNYSNGDAHSDRVFWATASAHLLLERFAKTGYLFTSRSGCPDAGAYVECSLRSGSNGNLLMTLSDLDEPFTRTVDISNCVASGQQTIRYITDWTRITITALAAGVATDTPTWPAGGAVFYLCSKNAAAEYAPPAISARLSDIPGASKVVVQYSHVPYMLNWNTANEVDCGTGACTIPWDGSLGKLYYRLLYVNASGAVIATSDMQTL